MAIPKLPRKKLKVRRRPRPRQAAEPKSESESESRWRFRWRRRRAAEPLPELPSDVERRLHRQVAELTKAVAEQERLVIRAMERERDEAARQALAERAALRQRLEAAEAELLQHRLTQAVKAEDNLLKQLARQREEAKVWDQRGQAAKAARKDDLAEQAWLRRDAALEMVAVLERDLEALGLGQPVDWREMYADMRRLAAECDRDFAAFRARANNQE